MTQAQSKMLNKIVEKSENLEFLEDMTETELLERLDNLIADENITKGYQLGLKKAVSLILQALNDLETKLV
jgi:hypothetical protein